MARSLVLDNIKKQQDIRLSFDEDGILLIEASRKGQPYVSFKVSNKDKLRLTQFLIKERLGNDLDLDNLLPTD